jgi:hypothetical protein
MKRLPLPTKTSSGFGGSHARVRSRAAIGWLSAAWIFVAGKLFSNTLTTIETWLLMVGPDCRRRSALRDCEDRNNREVYDAHVSLGVGNW